MRRTVAPLLFSIALFACTKPFDHAAHARDVMQWRERRAAGLKKEDSWLTLVGLTWLSPGANTIGSAASNAVVLPPAAPALCGTLTLEDVQRSGLPGPMVVVHDQRVMLNPDPAAGLTIGGHPVTGPVELIDDTKPNGPTVVQVGTIRFQIIRRVDRFGVRIKDAHSPARLQFHGLDYYPIDSKWRIEARFEPYNPPRHIPITNVLGQTTQEVSPGALVFDIDGKEYRLDPILEAGEKDLFIIFKDQTSRDTTYPAGRFLYASPAGPDGKVVVDFNKAYNPPCAFSPFATCPLPPPQNRLPFRIEAGEKKYGEGHD